MERTITEDIKDSDEILTIFHTCAEKLIRVFYHSVEMNVQFCAFFHRYHSSKHLYLLKHVQPNKSFIHLNEVQHVNAYFIHPTGLMQFESTITAETIGGQKKLLTQLPQHLQVIQQRGAFRVQPKSANMSMCFDHDCEVKGRIIDISESGICLRVAGNLSLFYNLNEIIDQCSIHLDDYETLDCKLSIKRIDFDQKKAKTTIAATFLELNQAQREKLRKFVMTCQRYQLRNFG